MSPAEAAADEREVTLTTIGRKTGKPRRVIVWIATDGRRLFIRSGQGMKRDWPKNLVVGGEATLNLGDQTIKVTARLVAEPAEARAVSQLVRTKYGSMVKTSNPGEPLTPAEGATFELIPVA